MAFKSVLKWPLRSEVRPLFSAYANKNNCVESKPNKKRLDGQPRAVIVLISAICAVLDQFAPISIKCSVHFELAAHLLIRSSRCVNRCVPASAQNTALPIT